MSSIDYGLRLNRPRLYNVGIRRRSCCGTFGFPGALARVHIDSVLDCLEKVATLDDLPSVASTPGAEKCVPDYEAASCCWC